MLLNLPAVVFTMSTPAPCSDFAQAAPAPRPDFAQAAPSRPDFAQAAPDRTADGRLLFDKVVYGRTLGEWAALAHADMAKIEGWGNCPPPARGTYGFDNLVHSVAAALARFLAACPATFSGSTRLAAGVAEGLADELADAVHGAWAANYVYWRDERPAKRDPRYRAPHAPLGDKRRDELAAIPFARLPKDEARKDAAIAASVLSYLTTRAAPAPAAPAPAALAPAAPAPAQ